MDVCFIFGLSSNITLFILLLKLFQFWLENSFHEPVSLTHPRLFVVGALPYFLALPDFPGPPYIVSTPALETFISPRSPNSFHWRMELETMIWVVSVLVASGVYAFFKLHHSASLI